MAILAIIFGILLILFGGGCTLIMGGLMISDPSSIISDFGTLLSVLLPFGILPLAAGIFLIRWGVKKDRERRAAKPPPQ
jgi:hypothetical protein